MPVDPQIQKLLDEMREAGAKPFEELSVPEARAAAWSFGPLQGKPEEVASIEHTFIPGPTAELPVRIYTPATGDGPYPGLVYYHGSGWVVLNIAVCDTTMRALANSTGCKVVAVNYQKAPEHPFPIPFDDCWAATNWIFENAEKLNLDAARIGVIGDSAGGNLAAAVALKARDVGAPTIAFQALIYPAVEHNWDSASAHENAEGYLLQRESMRWFWNHYVQDEALADDPRVSPLKAGDHSGLPPAFIATAEFDPLRDDGRAYHAKLHDAGVPVTYVEYDGMIHGFYWMQGIADGARRLHADLAEAIREVLAPAHVSA
ncbi:alpha/beta hydrolase [Solirubrobacter ginsenosidimutans]|uniref:Alpha/beta hydrolase n=1 Tax=Solirubrobacter ginsenosidimutans TaxID=490573 RepID=A0A9X3MTN6_9ACTN|nr:alpha/beta hydrolase [Solirubrobacter ginsenosidimutans]MDA0162469.1 alpha/beta hydrolase [Solirubrobacter ginsenosidimutans]